MRDSTRGLWVALMIIAAAMVSIIMGFLSWAGGLTPALAAVTGGGAFSAAVLLMIAIKSYLDGEPRS